MTSQTKTTLKGYFNNGDIPTEAQFADLIDTIGQATLTVAASDASDGSKGRADYVCDGTNDEVQIQAAIDALPAGGGKVQLTEGTFTLAASTNMDLSTTCYTGLLIDENDGAVELAGTAGTVLKLAASQPVNSCILLITGLTEQRTARTLVTGIEFDGNDDNQTGTWNDFGLIAIIKGGSGGYGVVGVTIRDCYFHDWYSSYGVYVASFCERTIIKNNRFSGNSKSLIVHDSYQIVSNNIFIGTVGATSGAMVNLVPGEAGWGQGGDSSITGNIFYGGYNQLVLSGGARTVISNNVFAGVTNVTGIALVIQHYDDGGSLRIHALNNVVISNIFYDIKNGIKLNGNNSYGTRNTLVAFNQVIDGPSITLNYAIEDDNSASSGNRHLFNWVDTGATNPLVATSTGTVVEGNVGYVTENKGAAANVADGGTITHGLAATPTVVIATPSVAGEMVSVTALAATTFTVAIKKHDNSAGTAQTIYWRAYV